MKEGYIVNCPYCNQSISSEDLICPHCGQVISTSKSTNTTKEYQSNYSRNARTITESVQKDITLQKKKKQDSAWRKVALLFAIIAIACGLAYFFYFVPTQRYITAQGLFDEGKYVEAYEVYSQLGEFKESPQRLRETAYILAEREEANGNSRQAAILFGRAIGFQDAKERSRALWLQIGNQQTILVDNRFAVAICNDGSVSVTNGQSEDKHGINKIANWKNIIAIDGTRSTIIGITSDGRAVTAGFYKPNVSNWDDLVSVAAGGNQRIVLKMDGTVIVDTSNNGVIKDTKQWSDIVAVAAGFNHVVGLKSDGTVVASGSNNNGECNVDQWQDIVSIAAGSGHTVGLRSDGTVVATGNNSVNQCNVGGWRDVVSIDAENGHTFCVFKDGTIHVVGSSEDYWSQVVSDWNNVASIQYYNGYLLALMKNGTIKYYDGWVPELDLHGVRNVIVPKALT